MKTHAGFVRLVSILDRLPLDASASRLLWKVSFAFAVCGRLIPAYGTQLQLSVLDSETGKPIPCRIYLKNEAGKPVRPQKLPFWHDHFVSPGVAELEMSSGAYSYELDRGPE